MPKNLLLVLILTVILITAYWTLTLNAGSEEFLTQTEIDTAVNQAQHLYRQEKGKNRDFSNGPCLSDALLPGWVMDIVHNPRLPIDDFAENQCPGFVEGRMKHIVELDSEGNLIRAE